MKIELSVEEAQLIVTALQKSDPMGIYVNDFVKRIVSEANSQIIPPKEPKAPKE